MGYKFPTANDLQEGGEQFLEGAGGVLSGDPTDLLAFQECTEAAVSVAQGAADVAAGIGAIVGSGGTATAAAVPGMSAGSKQVLVGAMTELATQTNKYLWAGYLLVMAQQGALIASASDAGAWYRVTHKGCGGARNTLGSSMDKMGKALGLYLGTPAVRGANNLTESNLASFFSVLKAQGMDGLEPVKSEITSGFKESSKASGAPSTGGGAGKGTGGLVLKGGFQGGGAAPSAPIADDKKAWLAAAAAAALFFL